MRAWLELGTARPKEIGRGARGTRGSRLDCSFVVVTVKRRSRLSGATGDEAETDVVPTAGRHWMVSVEGGDEVTALAAVAGG